MSKSKAGDLYIASVIHVLRETKEKDDRGRPIKETVTIQPGQMVSDTDLTDDEIKDLKRHKGVLRAPTYEEIQAMEARPDAEAAKKAAEDAEAERQQLLQDQQFEKDRLAAEAKAKADEASAKLEADQAAEREKAAAASAKAAGGKGKK